MWLQSRANTYSQLPQSPLGTPGTTTVILCSKYEEKKHLQIMSLATYTSKTINKSSRSWRAAHRMVPGLSVSYTIVGLYNHAKQYICLFSYAINTIHQQVFQLTFYCTQSYLNARNVGALKIKVIWSVTTFTFLCQCTCRWLWWWKWWQTTVSTR